MMSLPTLPEPSDPHRVGALLCAYNAQDMHAYAAAARLAALEEVALMLCNMGYKGFGMDAFACAQAIYDLKNETA